MLKKMRPYPNAGEGGPSNSLEASLDLSLGPKHIDRSDPARLIFMHFDLAPKAPIIFPDL